MIVLHLNNGHTVLIEQWDAPPHLSADLAGPVPLGVTAPAVNDVRRVPVPRSMREAYLSTRNIEEAHGMVSHAPGKPLTIKARIPSLGNKPGPTTETYSDY